jgi:hypothetical protein
MVTISGSTSCTRFNANSVNAEMVKAFIVAVNTFRGLAREEILGLQGEVEQSARSVVSEKVVGSEPK